MTIPWAERGQSVRGYAMLYQGNITYTNGLYRAGYALAGSGDAPRPDPRIDHKLAYGFGMRREESAPAPVVPPAAGRHTLAAPEAQPPLHVCFGNPHPLTPGALSESDDVGHPFDDKRGEQ